MRNLRDNPVWTATYLVLLIGLCGLGVTLVHLKLTRRIEINKTFATARVVVDLLDLAEGDARRGEVVDAFEEHVTATTANGLTVYEGRRDGKTIGYVLPFEGAGHGGPIRGMIAIDAARQKILGLRITEQHEAADLGGVIQSARWQGDFAGRPVKTGGAYGFVVDNAGKQPNALPALTGASQTARSVCHLLNRTIGQFVSGSSSLEVLDLKLDAVTRATPGYPREWVKPPHLRKEIRRADFLVPAGASNLALNRPVTTSGPIVINGDLEQIVDGVKTCEEGDYVELDIDRQWVQIDLGGARDVYAIVVWFYYKNPIVYNDVIVSVADDEAFETNVRVLFNNDHDGSSGQGKGSDTAFFARWWGEIVDARGDDLSGTKARYVRVQTNGATGDKGNCYVEIAVYGK